MREREGVVARMVERDVAGESDILCSESEYMQRERLCAKRGIDAAARTLYLDLF